MNEEERLIEFLKQSNAIEGEYSPLALRQARYAWAYLITRSELTPKVLLKTHKILMRGTSLPREHWGKFRTVAVMVGGRPVLPAEHVELAIQEWCREANNPISAKKIIYDHIEYEKIHPFIDGNGRTGRLFINWARVKLGMGVMIIGEAKKHIYYKLFQPAL